MWCCHQKTERRIQPAGDGEGRGVLEARKMVKCAVVVSLEHKQPTTQNFGVSSDASKPWVCLLHCGDFKNPVLLPPWVPYSGLWKYTFTYQPGLEVSFWQCWVLEVSSSGRVLPEPRAAQPSSVILQGCSVCCWNRQHQLYWNPGSQDVWQVPKQLNVGLRWNFVGP